MTRTISEFVPTFSHNRTTLNGIFTLQMPVGSIILSVKEQYNIPRIFAEYDTSNANNREPRRFKIFETDDTIPDPANFTLQYIDSFQTDNGQNDFHIYEIIPV